MRSERRGNQGSISNKNVEPPYKVFGLSLTTFCKCSDVTTAHRSTFDGPDYTALIVKIVKH